MACGGVANRQFYSLPESIRSASLNNDEKDNQDETQNVLLGSTKLQTDGKSFCCPANNGSSIKPTSHQSSGLLPYISENVIGGDKVFSGPYGLRKVTYLDYVASGKALHFIEEYIRDEVLPEYGNTHTTTSITSLQTTLFRHEARDIIRNACNASEHDSVIFCGSGTTGAVHKLIHGLHLNQSPVVFVGPFEHHSNILPWKEAGAEVIRIRALTSGQVDLDHLRESLQMHQNKNKQMIGAFSAASNVTGVLADVDAITVCLHKNGALAFWDYAAAAPYVKVDMNPYIGGPDQDMVYKDAVFFSMHKFVGGISTPGVLIAKKNLFQNPVPHKCGGGTVFFVRRENHRYLQEPEVKEEGGTPAIVESIRAGLVMQLKQAVGTDLIQDRDAWLLSQALKAWSHCTNLVMLGPRTTEKLPIFSFLIYHPVTGRFLHHNFVAAVLNDVFGIQARGGCACAGPYAMDILGLHEQTATIIEELIAEDSRLDRVHLRRVGEYSHREILRPGFVRLNLPYFLDNEGLDFVLEAVRLTAEHAWKLLPQYLFNPETGEWRQRNFQTFKDRKWLGHISYQSGQMKYNQPKSNVKGPLPSSHQDCIEKAKEIFAQAEKLKLKVPDQSVMFDEEARPYRWFVLPSEANACLQGNFVHPPVSPLSLPFCPQSLVEKLGFTNQDKNFGDNERKSVKEVNTPTTSVHNFKGDRQQTEPVQQSSHENEKTSNFSIPKISSNTDRDFVMKNPAAGCNFPKTQSDRAEDSSHISTSHEMNSTSGMQNCCSCRKKICKYCDKTIPSGSGIVSASRHMVTNKCDLPDSSKHYEKFTMPFYSGRPFSEGMIQALHQGFKKDVNFPVVSNDYLDSNSESNTDVNNSALNCYEVTAEDKITSLHSVSVKTEYDEKLSPLRSIQAGHNISVAPSQKGQEISNPSLEDKSGQTINNLRDSVVSKGTSEFTKSVQSNGQIELKENKLHQQNESGLDVCPPSATKISDIVNTKGKNSNTCPFLAKKKPALATNTEENESGSSASIGKTAVKWFSPPKQIFKPAVTAIEEYEMLKSGDKVLVCLSGGKDSLSLLHTVRQYQFYAKAKGVHFEFGAVTVDPQTPAYDPSPLKQYLATLGVPYFYEAQCILETAENLPYECASICSFCSRMKRGRIYAAARREGYNVLALGQHLDDLAESFLMSFFHNGNLNTMKAHYTVKKGDLRVIRPFVYVREADLRAFAEKKKLPVIAENCPACFEAPKERHRTKQLLAAQEVMFPHVYHSMMAALKPVMAKKCLARTGGQPVGTLVNGADNQRDTDDDDDDDCDI